MSDLVPESESQPPARAGGDVDPVKLLPKEWRPPVRFFYGFYSDILKGPTGLTVRFRMWIRDEGLTLDEAREVMKRLTRPERCAGIVYVGQLMAALADEVAEAVKARRQREQAARSRADDEVAKAGRANGALVRNLIAGLTQTPPTE